MKIFSSRLAEYRQKKRLSQEEMGKLLGVTGKYVGMLERGDKEVEDSSTISKLLGLYERREENPIESDFRPSGGDMSEEVSSFKGRSLLKAARLRQRLSQKELAAAAGYSLAVYQDIEEGRANMSRKMAERIAETLNVEVDDLLNGSDEPPSNGLHFGTVGATPPLILPPASKARYVPLLSMAQCGAMVAYDDSAYDHTGFLVINPKDRRAFSVRLAGESMLPVLSPGDIAVVYPSLAPKNNSLVLARLNEDYGSDVMVKLYQASQDQVTLISYNPLFPPMCYPRSAFSWIYPVASVSKILID